MTTHDTATYESIQDQIQRMEPLFVAIDQRIEKREADGTMTREELARIRVQRDRYQKQYDDLKRQAEKLRLQLNPPALPDDSVLNLPPALPVDTKQPFLADLSQQLQDQYAHQPDVFLQVSFRHQLMRLMPTPDLYAHLAAMIGRHIQTQLDVSGDVMPHMLALVSMPRPFLVKTLNHHVRKIALMSHLAQHWDTLSDPSTLAVAMLPHAMVSATHAVSVPNGLGAKCADTVRDQLVSMAADGRLAYNDLTDWYRTLMDMKPVPKDMAPHVRSAIMVVAMQSQPRYMAQWVDDLTPDDWLQVLPSLSIDALDVGAKQANVALAWQRHVGACAALDAVFADAVSMHPPVGAALMGGQPSQGAMAIFDGLLGPVQRAVVSCMEPAQQVACATHAPALHPILAAVNPSAWHACVESVPCSVALSGCHADIMAMANLDMVRRMYNDMPIQRLQQWVPHHALQVTIEHMCANPKQAIATLQPWLDDDTWLLRAVRRQPNLVRALCHELSVSNHQSQVLAGTVPEAYMGTDWMATLRHAIESDHVPADVNRAVAQTIEQWHAPSAQPQQAQSDMAAWVSDQLWIWDPLAYLRGVLIAINASGWCCQSPQQSFLELARLHGLLEAIQQHPLVSSDVADTVAKALSVQVVSGLLNATADTWPLSDSAIRCMVPFMHGVEPAIWQRCHAIVGDHHFMRIQAVWVSVDANTAMTMSVVRDVATLNTLDPLNRYVSQALAADTLAGALAGISPDSEEAGHLVARLMVHAPSMVWQMLAEPDQWAPWIRRGLPVIVNDPWYRACFHGVDAPRLKDDRPEWAWIRSRRQGGPYFQALADIMALWEYALPQRSLAIPAIPLAPPMPQPDQWVAWSTWWSKQDDMAVWQASMLGMPSGRHTMRMVQAVDPAGLSRLTPTPTWVRHVMDAGGVDWLPALVPYPVVHGSVLCYAMATHADKVRAWVMSQPNDVVEGLMHAELRLPSRRQLQAMCLVSQDGVRQSLVDTIITKDWGVLVINQAVYDGYLSGSVLVGLMPHMGLLMQACAEPHQRLVVAIMGAVAQTGDQHTTMTHWATLQAVTPSHVPTDFSHRIMVAITRHMVIDDADYDRYGVTKPIKKGLFKDVFLQQLAQTTAIDPVDHDAVSELRHQCGDMSQDVFDQRVMHVLEKAVGD